jgi:hypothetical protein
LPAIRRCDARPVRLALVTDTGGGIQPENLSKVFEPFFTTKSGPMRTGLGLAMIYGFVKQSKGHIRMYSEVGHGTTAKIYLPRMKDAARIESLLAAAHAESAEMPRARPGEVVLVVEDDDEMRDSTVALLEDFGYSVLSARNGAKGSCGFAAANELTSCSPTSFCPRA